MKTSLQAGDESLIFPQINFYLPAVYLPFLSNFKHLTTSLIFSPTWDDIGNLICSQDHMLTFSILSVQRRVSRPSRVWSWRWLIPSGWCLPIWLIFKSVMDLWNVQEKVKQTLHEINMCFLLLRLLTKENTWHRRHSGVQEKEIMGLF